MSQSVPYLAAVRLGAEFTMAWAVLDRLQMTRVLNYLADIGFFRAVDADLSEAVFLRTALSDPQIPDDLQDATSAIAAAFVGTLLTTADRAQDVAARQGLTGDDAQMFGDTAALMGSMPALLDPSIPHSRRHRELLTMRPLSVYAADCALNAGDPRESPVHVYMERMGRYGADYNYGLNRIAIELDIGDIVSLGTDEGTAKRAMLDLVDAKLDNHVGYLRSDEVEFVKDFLARQG